MPVSGNVSVSTLTKWAEEEGWIQDKSEEIRKRTKAALISRTANWTKKSNTPTREDIERAVLTNVQVIREHRKSLVDLRDLGCSIWKELKDNPTKLYITQYKGEIVEKVVGLTATEKSQGYINLTNAMSKIITHERQAFNLDDDNGRKDPIKMSDEELQAELDALRGQING